MVENKRRLWKGRCASGQSLNASKSVGVLFGREREREMPRGCEALTWLKYGQDEIPASLGITVGSEAQVSTQWRRLLRRT